jgi:hypothetical protein
MDNEIKKIWEEIQDECHRYVEHGMKDKDFPKNATYQDATNVFLFKKLAEFELRLRGLEHSNRQTKSYIGRNTPLK